MRLSVPLRIEHSNEDQTNGADKRRDDRQYRQDSLRRGSIPRERSAMPGPPLGDEAGV